MKNEKIKLIELFGGLGSFRKSLENLNYKVDCDYIENDKFAVQAYNLLFDENAKATDIKNYSYTDNKKIDILTAGFPCQDISQAGKQNLESGRTMLYQQIIRIIEEIKTEYRPNFIIIENVKNLLSKKNKFIIDDLISKINILGYFVRIETLNLLNFGLPQNRERVFIIFSKQSKYLLWNNFGKIKAKSLFNYLENKNYNDFQWKKVNIYKEFTNFIVIPRKKDNELINGSYNRLWKYDKYVGTINCTKKNEIFIKNSAFYRIYKNDSWVGSLRASYRTEIFDKITGYSRKLTSLECFRLFGWKDKDFLKLQTLKDCHKYKLIGNAIGIPVIENILIKILGDYKND